MDHDRLFKRLLSEFFEEFLRLFVPGLAARLDASELLPHDKELLGDQPPGARQEVDLLVRARVRDEPATFLIHVEAQAQHQPDFARRMFRYFTRLHEAHGMPVYPVAVLAHERPHRASPGLYEVVAAGRVVLRYEFEVIQLNRLRWEDFRDVANPVAAAFMARMHIARGERGRVKWACHDSLARLGVSNERAQRIVEFVEAYLQLDGQDQQVFREALQASQPAVKEAVMAYANQWVEMGKREGRQEGLQVGRHQAALDLLLRLLARRFGPVPDARREALAALPVETVEAMVEGIFEVASLEDLDRFGG
jgi:predicted transposase YdaD